VGRERRHKPVQERKHKNKTKRKFGDARTTPGPTRGSRVGAGGRSGATGGGCAGGRGVGSGCSGAGRPRTPGAAWAPDMVAVRSKEPKPTSPRSPPPPVPAPPVAAPAPTIDPEPEPTGAACAMHGHGASWRGTVSGTRRQPGGERKENSPWRTSWGRWCRWCEWATPRPHPRTVLSALTNPCG
jgi:hypothetical protein